MKTRRAKFSDGCSLFCGIGALILSFFFLLTDEGKSLFVPFEDVPSFLGFYYYLISYTLIFVGIYLIGRGLGILKK